MLVLAGPQLAVVLVKLVQVPRVSLVKVGEREVDGGTHPFRVVLNFAPILFLCLSQSCPGLGASNYWCAFGVPTSKVPKWFSSVDLVF